MRPDAISRRFTAPARGTGEHIRRLSTAEPRRLPVPALVAFRLPAKLWAGTGRFASVVYTPH